MKNTFRLIGIIAIVAIIGFSLVACGDKSGDDGSNNGGNTNNKKQLSGNYYFVGDDFGMNQYYSFSGFNWSGHALGDEFCRGTYTITGNNGVRTVEWVNSIYSIIYDGKVGDVELMKIINDTTFSDDWGTWAKR
jgi:hypothetical protein